MLGPLCSEELCSVRLATKSLHFGEWVRYSYTLKYLGRRILASMSMEKSSLVWNEFATREILGHEISHIVVCVDVYQCDCAVLD